MVKIKAKYMGNKKTTVTQVPTGETIHVDLPAKFGGTDSAFAPTDILTGALAACGISMMAVMADKRKDDLTGLSLEAEYTEAQNPERINKIVFTVAFPAAFTKEQKDFYVTAFKICPVHNSINPEIETVVNVK